jgi:hypothetical protein
MKNKKLTYVLGLAVAIVWGLIIYRIIASVNNGNDAMNNTPVAITKEPFNDYTVPKDTTHLLLNYRDPFGMVKFKDTVKTVSKHGKDYVKALPVKPVINWGFIKYSGYIRNPNSKKLIAIISIHGKSVELTEGETAENVKLIKNMRDSIKVFFDGKTKFISMHTGNI